MPIDIETMSSIRILTHMFASAQVFITPFGVLQFMDRLGDPTLKTLTKAVDTMRASMLDVIHVSSYISFQVRSLASGSEPPRILG